MIGYNNARRDISFAFYIYVFRVPTAVYCMTDQGISRFVHFVNSRYYTIVIRLYFVITRGVYPGSAEIRWKHEARLLDD